MMAKIPASPRSAYDNPGRVAAAVAAGRHRELIGGLWTEVGALQFDFLVAQGLAPHHRFIDIGCGSFRAGVRLIPYLHPGHYYGLDINEQLLRAGYDREIAPQRLAERMPWTNVAVHPDFDVSCFGVTFDYGIAHSVFTHLPIEYLTRCLLRLAPHFRSGGLFFATYFDVPETEAARPYQQPRGAIITHIDRNPFHHPVPVIASAVSKLPEWQLTVLGEWGHPRSQRMLKLERTGAPVSG